MSNHKKVFMNVPLAGKNGKDLPLSYNEAHSVFWKSRDLNNLNISTKIDCKPKAVQNAMEFFRLELNCETEAVVVGKSYDLRILISVNGITFLNEEFMVK